MQKIIHQTTIPKKDQGKPATIRIGNKLHVFNTLRQELVKKVITRIQKNIGPIKNRIRRNSVNNYHP